MDNTAFSYMNMGQWESAIQHIKDSLAIEPEGIHAAFSLGKSLFKLSDKVAAAPYYEKALTLELDLDVTLEYFRGCRR